MSRRRRRAERELAAADDGVFPAWIDDPMSVVRTPVGNVDSPDRGWVDAKGLVSVDGWSLDWWIGADDRWHLPTREVAVRQHLLDDMPVVETSMRVPGGDAVHRVYGARVGGADLLVVEIDNQSPAPFALALAVRPFDDTGWSRLGRIDLDGTTVLLEGRPSLLLPRPPSRVAGSIGAAGDVAAVVLGGAAGEIDAWAPVTCDRGGATAAFVYPVPHRTSVRVLVSLDGSIVLGGTVPAAEQVARGWRAHGGTGARLVLPDERLQSAIEANRRFLLLDPVGAVGAEALAAYGDAVAAAEVLRRLDADDADADLLHAAAVHARLHGDRELAVELASLVAHAADRLPRDAAADDLLAAAAALDAAGEDRAASNARKAAAGAASAPVVPAWVRAEDLFGEATPTWRWRGSDGARFLLAVRDLVAWSSDEGIDLLSFVPNEWLGQGIEVHDLPTPQGLLSWAVRWHGDRPALLWDLQGEGPVTLRAPGLDASWSTTDRKGEALLAPVAPATPVTLGRART